MGNIQKRTSKDGKASYRVQVRLKGHPAQTASFDRLTDARKWEQDTESAIRNGRHFKTSQAKKRTLAETIDRYFSEVLVHKKNPVNPKIYLTWWRNRIGDYALADVTSSMIVEQRNVLLSSTNKFGRKVGTTTANRYSQALGHVLNVARDEWEWIDINPLEKIKKYKESRGRVRFLNDDERDRLLDACKLSDNPYLHDIVVLAISTGARKTELLSLNWDAIDIDRGQIILHETKNGERRVIPLEGYALKLINDRFKMRNRDCEFVFPSEKVTKDENGKVKYQAIDIRTAWENALKRAEIADFRFHDLRHSAASYLAMNGAGLGDIAEVLGHKTLQMVKRYAHLSEAHTKTVVAKMNEKIWRKNDV